MKKLTKLTGKLFRKTFWTWIIFHYKHLFVSKNFCDLQFSFALRFLLTSILTIQFSFAITTNQLVIRDSVLVIAIVYFFVHKQIFLSYAIRIWLILNLI